MRQVWAVICNSVTVALQKKKEYTLSIDLDVTRSITVAGVNSFFQLVDAGLF